MYNLAFLIIAFGCAQTSVAVKVNRTQKVGGGTHSLTVSEKKFESKKFCKDFAARLAADRGPAGG